MKKNNNIGKTMIKMGNFVSNELDYFTGNDERETKPTFECPKCKGEISAVQDHKRRPIPSHYYCRKCNQIFKQTLKGMQ